MRRLRFGHKSVKVTYLDHYGMICLALQYFDTVSWHSEPTYPYRAHFMVEGTCRTALNFRCFGNEKTRKLCQHSFDHLYKQ
jgi:hypothetical protein